MLTLLTLLALTSVQSVPSDQVLTKAWRADGVYCGDLGVDVEGPAGPTMKKALTTLRKRGVPAAAARHLVRACTTPFDREVVAASLRAALALAPTGPGSLAVGVEVGKLLAYGACRNALTDADRAVVPLLPEPAQSLAAAVVGDGAHEKTAPVPGSSASTSSVALFRAALAQAPNSDERKLCLAASEVPSKPVAKCTEGALRIANISVTGKFKLKEILCEGNYARAFVSLVSEPNEGSAMVILHQENGVWKEIVNPGSGGDDFERCTDAKVPEATCLKLFKGICDEFPACVKAKNKTSGTQK